MGGFVVFTHGQVDHGEEGVTYTVTGGPRAPGRGHQAKALNWETTGYKQ